MRFKYTEEKKTDDKNLFRCCLHKLLSFLESQPPLTTKNENSTISGENNITKEADLTTTKEATKTNEPVTTKTSTHKRQSLCDSYATIVDDSRLFSNSLKERKCDLFFKRAVRFMSSDGKDLKLKENCSSDEVDKLRYYCGGDGLTYIEQLHPDESDIPTPASLCINSFFDSVTNSDFRNFKLREDIFPRPDCICNNRQYILVQNCSGFYVYQLFPISPVIHACPARYCTEKLGKYRFFQLLIFLFFL